MATRILLALGILASGLNAGCTISDEDRCPEGYEFKEITLSCHPLPTDEGNGSDAPSTNEDSESEAPDGPPTGLGEPCADNPNACVDAGFEADYCAVNPLEADKAYCTSQGCLEDSCEDGFRCCDCTQSKVLPKVSACLKDADADLAGSPMGGCQC